MNSQNVDDVPVFILKQAPAPLPPFTAYIPVSRNIRTQDSKQLATIPWFNDEKKDSNEDLRMEILEKYGNVVSDTSNEKVFFDAMERFSKHVSDDRFIDLVKNSDSNDSNKPRTSESFSNPQTFENPKNEIFQAISRKYTKGEVDHRELRKKYFKLIKRSDPEIEISPNIDGPITDCDSREKCVKNFQRKFCRFCFMYGCLTHKQLEESEILQKSGQRRSSNNLVKLPSVSCGENCYLLNIDSSSSKEKNEVWNVTEKTMFELVSSDYNFCDIAKLIETKSCAQVQGYAQYISEFLEVKSPPPTRKLTDDHLNCSTEMSSIKEKKIFRKQEQKHMSYTPCSHSGPCKLTCSCIKNSNFCEKFCICAYESTICGNRFKGCRECIDGCNTEKCRCFAVARECDPDSCKSCGAHEFEVSKIICKNVNLQRRLSKQVKVRVSGVSGWGVFIDESVKKNDFINVSLNIM